ncbi:helix-turn-helix transcriptional regulator [Chitinophaga polysaccharea]|uniref:helix-turn-helix transcriptional regulator n=1 Tax=Chitinophaga polysaccharea TaxID=1293035 RepID=UPI00115952A2|nr:helix-turn-helix transcriptional regulator [Chitinophaga polysaccharea]
MSQPITKYLLINPGKRVCTTYEQVPGYLHSQLIPNAKCFTDIDEDGVIIDQHIQANELSISYHLIHLKKGVALTTIAPGKNYLPVGISGFAANSSTLPMTMKLGKKELNTLKGASDTATLVTEKEFVVSFEVNLHLPLAKYMVPEFPLFGALNVDEPTADKQPVRKTPYHLNEVNYQIMHRIRSFKAVGETADVFFRRNAIDFYATYLRFLQAPPPLMLMEQYREKLREIANYIIHHPAETTTKEALCDKFGVASEFLEAPFEQEFLITVEELILQEKMAFVFKMLTETNRTLTHIASVTRYSNWEELSAVFEKYYKCNIAELRAAQ